MNADVNENMLMIQIWKIQLGRAVLSSAGESAVQN